MNPYVPLSLAIHGAAMVDLVDQDEPLLSQDLVENPTISHSDPVGVLPSLELGDPMREGIVLQLLELLQDSRANGLLERNQLTIGPL